MAFQPAGANRATSGVRKAVEYWDEYGEEESVRYYNSAKSIDGEFYVVIMRLDKSGETIILRHAFQPDLVGPDAPVVATNDGESVQARLWEAGMIGGGWVSSFHPRSVSPRDQRKHAYAESHPDDRTLLFVSRYYEPVNRPFEPVQ